LPWISRYFCKYKRRKESNRPKDKKFAQSGHPETDHDVIANGHACVGKPTYAATLIVATVFVLREEISKMSFNVDNDLQ
jgi:uncharacterized membrane protein